MTVQPRYDAVIVGARVAGASTALLLARAGARVALVDRSSIGTDRLCAHALTRAGVMQLSRWGLLAELIAAGTPPIRRTAFHYADLGAVHVSVRRMAGVEALYAPRRSLLDRVLVEAAARAGADVLPEVNVLGLHQDDRGRVCGVRGTDRAGRIVDVGAETTIGADGLDSTVARLVGASVVRRGESRSAMLHRYVHDLPDSGYEWAYGHRAAAGLIPTNDGQTGVFVSAAPDQIAELSSSGSDAAFRILLARAGPALVDRFDAAVPAGPVRGWPGAPCQVRRPWGPGWALVGDAGSYRDPITTHGMTDALRDAELLAGALLAAARGTPKAIALAGYAATRDHLSRRLLAATERVAAYDWCAEEVQGLIRQVSSAMSDEVNHLRSPAELLERPGSGTTLGRDGRGPR